MHSGTKDRYVSNHEGMHQRKSVASSRPSTFSSIPIRNAASSSKSYNGSRKPSRSSSSNNTPAELDTSLPKNFPKPLTCHFWHQNGRCSKRDVDCAYAHYDTGFISSAPVTPLGGMHKLTQTPIKQRLTKQNNSFRSLRWQEHRQVRQETRHAHAIAGRSTEAGEYCGWR